MKEQLVSFETAKLGKEKGFCGIKSQCINWYFKDGRLVTEKNITGYKGLQSWNNWDATQGVRWDAPTQSLLQKWLRQNHSIHITVDYNPIEYEYTYCVYKNSRDKISHELKVIEDEIEYFQHFEQALEEALIEALKLIEK